MRRRGTLSGERDPPVIGEAAVPEDRENSGDGGSSSFGSEPIGHIEEVLGRPTVDPWYRSSERFPSVPADPQPLPMNWEWLVVREDAAAVVAWVLAFREIRDF